jgi:hypothetical protein
MQILDGCCSFSGVFKAGLWKGVDPGKSRILVAPNYRWNTPASKPRTGCLAGPVRDGSLTRPCQLTSDPSSTGLIMDSQGRDLQGSARRYPLGHCAGTFCRQQK